MFKIIMKIVVFVGLSIGLYAGNGLAQSHLVSVSPGASESGVSQDVAVEVKFDLPIKEKSVKEHTIVLKQNNKKVQGVTTLVGDDTLRFTPNESLEEGSYKVKVKKVKLQKEKSNDNAQYEPKNGFQRFIYWLCSLFYDNPSDCPLCKKICGNSGHASKFIKTHKITYEFNVDSLPKVLRLNLSIEKTKLHEGNETNYEVEAIYDDNTTKNASENIEWIVSKSGIVSLGDGTLVALKEGNITVQAKYKSKLSGKVVVTVYKEINGYILPPEPDKTINNATLLGVDSNDNGVRDDVERHIIKTYGKEKIAVEIGFQVARAYNAVIENPANAEETSKIMDNAMDCESYFKNDADMYGDPILIKDRIITSRKFKSIQLNTEERIRGYLQYNRNLSGGVFTLTHINKQKEKCAFDVVQMLKDRK